MQYFDLVEQESDDYDYEILIAARRIIFTKDGVNRYILYAKSCGIEKRIWLFNLKDSEIMEIINKNFHKKMQYYGQKEYNLDSIPKKEREL